MSVGNLLRHGMLGGRWYQRQLVAEGAHPVVGPELHVYVIVDRVVVVAATIFIAEGNDQVVSRHDAAVTRTEDGFLPPIVEWQVMEEAPTRWINAKGFEGGPPFCDADHHECYWHPFSHQASGAQVLKVLPQPKLSKDRPYGFATIMKQDVECGRYALSLPNRTPVVSFA
jgi:hypothetical protein